MTVEEYRQRMIDAFHNADCDELIALVALPTEKEFEHLEWLLEKHYKTKPKTGHWIEEINDYGKVTGWHCDKCYEDSGFTTDCKWDFCPNCGCRIVEPQESEDKE